jgi:hypothetical protein
LIGALCRCSRRKRSKGFRNLFRNPSAVM